MSKLTYFISGIALVLFSLTAIHHFTGGPGLIGVVMDVIDPGHLSRNSFARDRHKVAPAAVDSSLVALPALPEYEKSFKLEIRQLLRARKFEELNDVLYSLQQQSKPNSNARDQLFIADYAFQLDDDDFELLIGEWIEVTPKQYQPYLARANYYYDKAWKARGHKWASETKDEQIERFRSFLLKSLADLNVAKKLNDKPIGIYRLSIATAHLLGQREVAQRVLAKAMEIDPGDYQTKATHLKFLKPRWGGSIEAMGEFVEESLVYLPENPRLNWLTGLVYDEVADISKDRKARNEAEKYYSQALSFGENYLVYLHRGKNRYQLDKNNEALADLDKAISLYPERSGSYYWRSVVYSELEEYEKSANDLIRAYQLDPYDASVLKRRDWLTKKMIFNGYEFGKDQKYDKALEQFNYAERLNPDNPDIYQRRARVLADLNQINLASNDLKKSISLDPEDYGAYAL